MSKTEKQKVIKGTKKTKALSSSKIGKGCILDKSRKVFSI